MAEGKRTPGFSTEEIYRAFDSGDRVAAVKMLRAETDVGLKEAMDALNGRNIEYLPSFAEAAKKKRIERSAHELLAVCQEVSRRLGHLQNEMQGRLSGDAAIKFGSVGVNIYLLNTAIAKATGGAE